MIKTNHKIKKAAVHTIEAFISFMVVIGFILTVMPAITTPDDTTQSAIIDVYNSIDYLEKTGQLRAYILDGNLSGLNESLYNLISKTHKFSIGLSKVNATYNNNAGNYTINYTANIDTIDYAIINIVYINAQNPEIYVNGNLVLSNTGDVSGSSDSVDITKWTIDGINQVQFNFSANTNTKYNLLVSDSSEYGNMDQLNDVHIISYLISGLNDVFLPAELKVYIW